LEAELLLSNKVVIERVLGGIGDCCMCRPAINAYIAQNPEREVYIRTSRPLDDVFKDINCAGILLDPPKFEYEHFDLNSPCLDYELSEHPFAVVNQKKLIRRDHNIILSRQEVFCGVVGTKFDQSNYDVKFTEQELDFAETYTKGLSNILLVHCNSNEISRTYKYESALLDYVSKHWDGYVIAIRPKKDPKINNVVVWQDGGIRQLWSVMTKSAAGIMVDSGPIHLMGAVGGVVYGIFGPIDPAIRLKYKHAYWKPINCKYTKNKPCWYTPCKGVYCMSRYPKEIFRDAMTKMDLSVNTRKEHIKPITIVKLKPEPDIMKDVAICRIRGIGDILLSLPAMQAYKRKYPHINIDYITDVDMVDILKSTGLFRNVIGVKYNHIGSGYPELPPGINIDIYNHVYNLINRVDFEKESSYTPRIELFAKELGVEKEKLERVAITVPLDWYAHIGGRHDRQVVIQSDSNGESRKWSIQRQIELCYLLKDKFLITATGLNRNDSFPDFVNNLTGMQTLKEYFVTISEADIVIAPDSSAVHIAGCLGVKCIGLYGSVNPLLRTAHYPSVYTITGKGKCVPCNDWQDGGCKGMKNYPMCLYSIRAKTVYNKIMEVL
jgi:ADP-heptose:LPS heptosyltransferase